MSPQLLVIATGNPHKVDELRLILRTCPLPIAGLKDLPNSDRFTEPSETGETFVENARIKALSYARQTGHICLADDSGLEIDALDGRPGVISSHYATAGRETGLSRTQRDQANNAAVLAELAGVSPERRTARFVCTMCIADPSGAILAETRGTFEGRIGEPPRVPAGQHGFGYDPLFLVAPAFTHTGAELLPDEKSRVSHRALAAQAITAQLSRLTTAH